MAAGGSSVAPNTDVVLGPLLLAGGFASSFFPCRELSSEQPSRETQQRAMRQLAQGVPHSRGERGTTVTTGGGGGGLVKSWVVHKLANDCREKNRPLIVVRDRIRALQGRRDGLLRRPSQ